MIKRPTHRVRNAFELLESIGEDAVGEYLPFYSPIDSSGRYLPYDEFRFRVPSGLNVDYAWQLRRLSRKNLSNEIIKLGAPEIQCTLYYTSNIQITISETDRFTTEAMLDWINNKFGESRGIQYLLNDLIEDESISSSQLEGAATTTIVAKNIIKNKASPRTVDERMIVGNFKLMMFAWENRDAELTTDLIKEFHITGVSGIDDDSYHPGKFRKTENVVVTDREGNIVHQPPTYKGLSERLAKVSEWVNKSHNSGRDYLHPLVKAIILHFIIGYEHPFHDGNGRVARALFYWYMFKHGYHAFRYIAISTLLKKAPAKYGKSYLYTETDDMDLTYFVDYQCDVIKRAIDDFKEVYEKTLKKIEEFNVFVYSSGLLGSLSDREKIIFQVASSSEYYEFTTNEVAKNLGCSYNTASTSLNNLVKMGIFNKTKEGKEWIYRMNPHEEILGRWKNKRASW
ncbi:cell filamentation protein Fic [Thiopseudomonas alkaliphila]|uniref:Cell filamentation protein Fic n=1 Tax=Thiopseudomonas alkaliphila TaxID=1697053 RepID=A0A0K1XGF4_9GAMM|nr:Fic family protein [Thiopseudomonas alkaliphila]AKX60475.1 cell filamentation protein Fic [Thiopseudomonas alkaliphila]